MSAPRRVTLSALAVLVPLLLLLGSAGCPTGPSGPDEENCTDDMPGRGGVTALELGAPGDGAFTALTEGQILATQRGGQGFQMIVVRLRATGDVGACLTTRIQIRRDGETETQADSQSAVLTHARPDGSRETANIYVIMGFGDIGGNALTLSASAGGATTMRRVFADRVELDAGLTPD